MLTTPTHERIVLTILNDAAPRMVPEPQLWNDANAASATPITRDLLRQVLERLRERQQVLAVRNDDGVRWKISGQGEARLQELNLAEQPRL